MNRNYKVDLDTKAIKYSLAGVITGLVTSFGLTILGTICIEKEFIDMSYVAVITYTIHFMSAFLATILTTTILKNKTAYIAVIIPAAMILCLCVIAIFLFDGLSVTVLTKVLTLLAGGLLGCFVKKALPGTRKARKKRVRNW